MCTWVGHVRQVVGTHNHASLLRRRAPSSQAWHVHTHGMIFFKPESRISLPFFSDNLFIKVFFSYFQLSFPHLANIYFHAHEAVPVLGTPGVFENVVCL